MHIPKLMQLPYTSDYLKQYLVEFAIFMVLSEILSEVHSMSVKDKYCNISAELYIIYVHNVLAFLLFSFNKDHIFIVELLS